MNTPEMQIVFSDTPGVLKPNYKLQESMLAFSESALQDADVLLYVTDVVEDPEKNMDFLEKVQNIDTPVILLINKIDELASPESQARLTKIVERWHALLPKAEILPISAKNKFGTDILLKRIQELLPESPAYFDKDQLTDKPARFFVSEIIREKILLYYDKSVERFKEDEKHIHINAIIYVERDSQKGIIIGHQGVALKKVSTEARKALEKFFDKPIYLEVFVKVTIRIILSQRISVDYSAMMRHQRSVCCGSILERSNWMDIVLDNSMGLDLISWTSIVQN